MAHDAHHDHHGDAHGYDHGHAHWDTSIWPFVISFGILFLAVAFSYQFVYHNGFAAILCLGLAVPMIIAGIAGWTSEAMGKGEGLSYGAMGWFILAEAMIFVSFFVGYWYTRLHTEVWPPAGTIELPRLMPMVMTAVLVGSSLTIHYAEHLLHLGNKGGFRLWYLVTIVMGAVFLGMSIYEWSHLMHQGFTVSTNSFSTVFFSITGLHGSHVVVGLAIFLAGLPSVIRGDIDEGFMRTAGLYWHFVDVIWFFVVSQVYYW
ncbi:MAG: heme-copper oxidase subunit III [Rhodocyclaceae bacterium]|nr:heme-copper oxidase subunit III [Rhodocyclaceae bacterium]